MAVEAADVFYMQAALAQAHQAAQQGEVPVGAVVVIDDQIVGRGFNATIATHDPSAHAEIIALRNAAQHVKNYRLDAARLYCTLEPCAMCAGAIFHSRVHKVIYAADDAKTGVVRSVLQLFDIPQLNHHCKVHGGVLAADAIQLLQNFFSTKRVLPR